MTRSLRHGLSYRNLEPPPSEKMVWPEAKLQTPCEIRLSSQKRHQLTRTFLPHQLLTARFRMFLGSRFANQSRCLMTLKSHRGSRVDLNGLEMCRPTVLRHQRFNSSGTFPPSCGQLNSHFPFAAILLILNVLSHYCDGGDHHAY